MDEDYMKRAYIAKADLKVGATYKGHCRNADKAKWDGTVFKYTRHKFSLEYIEEICHPEDDNGFDVFYPYELIKK